MHRTTQRIGAATTIANAPEETLEAARAALDALAGLDDDAFVEVQIDEPRPSRAVFPAGYLRRYLAAQLVPGREVLVFDSDEEISPGAAAAILDVSRRHLDQLLNVEAIACRRVGNQRRIRVQDVHAYRQNRERRYASLREIADVINESAGGWTR